MTDLIIDFATCCNLLASWRCKPGDNVETTLVGSRDPICAIGHLTRNATASNLLYFTNEYGLSMAEQELLTGMIEPGVLTMRYATDGDIIVRSDVSLLTPEHAAMYARWFADWNKYFPS